jgi:hypothetical protein
MLAQILLHFVFAIGSTFGVEHETKNPTTPDCTLKGAAKSPSEPMGRVIRIFLDATDWEDCKQMVTFYCKQDILKAGYLPQGLEGEFKPAPPQVTTSAKKYRVTQKCRVVVLPPAKN